MEHEYKLTLDVKKNSRTGKEKLRPSQKLKSDLETDFTYIAKSGAVIEIETGRANQLDILYTPSLFTSDKHNEIESTDDFIEYISDKYPVKFKVNYSGINRDSPDMVLRSYDQSESEKSQLADRLTKLESEYSQLEKEQSGESESNIEAELVIQERDELLKSNQTLQTNLEEVTNQYSEIIERDESLNSNQTLQTSLEKAETYSKNPIDLLNSIVKESREKFSEDHSNYSANAEKFGYDDTLEYVIMLVESSSHLDINKQKFAKKKILKADETEKIFDDSKMLKDILVHYELRKQDGTLDQTYDSIQRIEAMLAENTQDEPIEVTDARGFVEMYEGWEDGILKEQSLSAYESSITLIEHHNSDKMEDNKDLEINRGIIKLIENYSEELNESDIMFSDVKNLIQERDSRAENDDEYLYFGIRAEEGIDKIPIEPLPRKVAESLGYTLEGICISQFEVKE